MPTNIEALGQWGMLLIGVWNAESRIMRLGGDPGAGGLCLLAGAEEGRKEAVGPERSSPPFSLI